MTGDASCQRTLVRGGRVYDHDGDVHQPRTADLLISNGKIERVDADIAPEAGVEVIEARGKLVVPGFVNAHYHSHDVLMKGMFEEMPFDIWALNTNASHFGRRSLAEVRLRTLIGAGEALRNGITTIQDFLTVWPKDDAYVDTVLSAYAEVGIRVVLSIAARDVTALDISPFIPKDLPPAIRDRMVGQKGSAGDELDFVAAQIKRRSLHPGTNQTWAISPSAPQRCSRELLEGLAALSREHDLPVLTHVYETRIQAAAARANTSDSAPLLLEALARAGLMNEKLSVVHGVWLSPRDIAMMAEAGARLVHNPMSNLRLKSGVAPILELQKAGIEIALGCDNCSCGDTQNIFVAMRLLCALPAVTSPEPGPITAAYAVKAATLAGARALGLQGQVGALKPGMAADFMILNLDEPAFVPFNSAARQMVFSECGRAVETVFVGGRPVVRGGKLSTVDEAKIAADAAEISPAFRREIEELGRRNAELVEPLLRANRIGWQVPVGFNRYIGRPNTD